MPALDIDNPGVTAIASFGALLNTLLDEAAALKPPSSEPQSLGIDPPLTKSDFDNTTNRVDLVLSSIVASPSESDDEASKERVRDRRWQVVETAARDLFGKIVTSTRIDSPEIVRIWNLFDILTIFSDNGQCEPGLLFWLIEELVESQTIADCRIIFDYLESRRERITPEKTFKKWSLIVLRMCNELLRRLSRAEDSAFCGRVFIFLFQSFPLGDRSSVNLRGEYHVENLTNFESTSADDESKMEVDTQPPAGDSSTSAKASTKKKDETLSSDALYALFWPLQDSFSQPLKLFDTSNMQVFRRGIEETVKKFETFPSDEGSRTLNPQEDSKTGVKRKREDDDHEELPEAFNPKYLTSKDLFELEISDLTFRRHILVQTLITLNFILSWTAESKKKYERINVINKAVLYNGEFSEDDAKWAKQIKARIADYMRKDTPGKIFYRMVDTVLARDKNWVYWKMASCPKITREPVEPQIFAEAQQTAQRIATNKRLRPNPMGAVSLDFLQSTEGDDPMNQYKDPSRYQLPELETFKSKIDDDDFSISMASTDQAKASAVAGKASKSWRALRVAGRFKLVGFDKIDDPQKIDIIFQELGEDAKDEESEDAEDPPENREPIIISGSDGADESGLVENLLESHKGVFTKVVRHTTREPQDGEVNGKHYYFVKPQEFNQLRDGDRLIEFADKSDGSYGTSTKVIDAITENDRVPIIELDLEAAQFAKDMGFSARYIRVKAPSSESQDGEDKPETSDEPEADELFDTSITLDNLESAVKTLHGYIYGTEEEKTEEQKEQQNGEEKEEEQEEEEEEEAKEEEDKMIVEGEEIADEIAVDTSGVGGSKIEDPEDEQ